MASNQHLILIDVQNDFITGTLALPGADAVAEKIKNFVNNHVELYDNITATIDSHKKTPERCPPRSVEEEVFPVHCLSHSHGAALYEGLAEHIKYFIEKNTFMADRKEFEALSLDYDYGVHEFDICGFATDICVLSNALLLRNLYRDAKITVFENLCVGTTPENHAAAIQLMKTNCINIKSV